MGLFSRLASPVRGVWYLRRLHVELRGIRVALERQAAVMELQALPHDAHGERAQTFRGTTTLKHPLTPRELHQQTDITYVDHNQQARMLEQVEDLKAVLGREPTEEELDRVLDGMEV